MRRTILGVVLLLLGAVTFIVVDPVLAWDDANEYLGQGRLFLYFTAQSNLLATAAFVLFGVLQLRGRTPGQGAELLRGLATIDMAITGIVNGVLLSAPGAPWSFSDFWLHQGAPVLMALWWVLQRPAAPLPFAAIGLWLLHPVLWTASVLMYASESSDNWYPYFFLDPAEVGGWGAVAVFVVVIHAVIALLGLGAVAVSRARRRAR